MVLHFCSWLQVSTHGYSQNQILVWKYPSLTQVAKLTGHSYRVLYLVSWEFLYLLQSSQCWLSTKAGGIFDVIKNLAHLLILLEIVWRARKVRWIKIEVTVLFAILQKVLTFSSKETLAMWKANFFSLKHWSSSTKVNFNLTVWLKFVVRYPSWSFSAVTIVNFRILYLDVFSPFEISFNLKVVWCRKTTFKYTNFA